MRQASSVLRSAFVLLVLASPLAAQGDTAAKIPFSNGDFSWMNGQSRLHEPALATKFATFSFYFDGYYQYSSNHPLDNTVVGNASAGRHNEFQVNLASVGVEFDYKHAIGRLSLQAGNMLNIVQDLDGSVARGRNTSVADLRMIREAAAGYHFDAGYGINVEAGIFASYIGLESYLLGENWNYNRSLVNDFTPSYFQGLRAQFHPTRTLKIEPWLMNGFQTYGSWNRHPSLGLSIYFRPEESLGFIGNFYYGTDTKGTPGRHRFHSDHSVLARYVNRPESRGLSKAAFSINNHIGFESGGFDTPKPARMLGTSVVNRLWFDRNRYAFSLRGEIVSNPTRYLAPAPTPNGFPDAATETKFVAGGVTATFDIMPSDNVTFRVEAIARRANVPFFAGPGGTTSIDGYQGTPGDFTPDLVKSERRVVAAIAVRW